MTPSRLTPKLSEGLSRQATEESHDGATTAGHSADATHTKPSGVQALRAAEQELLAGRQAACRSLEISANDLDTLHAQLGDAGLRPTGRPRTASGASAASS